MTRDLIHILEISIEISISDYVTLNEVTESLYKITNVKLPKLIIYNFLNEDRIKNKNTYSVNLVFLLIFTHTNTKYFNVKLVKFCLIY